MPILPDLPPSAAVVLIRLRSLGDCVLTTPALRILRAARPDLRIAVVAENRFAPVFSGNFDVDAVLPPEAGRIRRWRPQLCLNLHGGTRSLFLTALSGARFRAGFQHFRGASVYNLRIPAAQQILKVGRKVHTAEHVASAIFWLGAPHGEIPGAHLVASPTNRPRPYAVIHPAASHPDKTWPAEGFLKLARRLRDEQHLDVVFIAGPGDDLSQFAGFESQANPSLETSKSLIAGASLFIGNDSGPAHIAAAFGVPVIVLFGPSDSCIWAPWRVESQVLQSVPISGISVDDVFRAGMRLVSRSRALSPSGGR